MQGLDTSQVLYALIEVFYDIIVMKIRIAIEWKVPLCFPFCIHLILDALRDCFSTIRLFAPLLRACRCTIYSIGKATFK